MGFDFRDKSSGREAAEAWNSVGKMIASEIGVGLDENSYLAITAMENVYVELETLYKSAAKNAESLAKKTGERKLDNLKQSLKLELITEREYYEKLKQYRDESLSQGTEAWYKCTEEIAAYNKRLLKEQEELALKQEELQRQMAEKALALQEKLASKLRTDGSWVKKSKLTFKGINDDGTDAVYSSVGLENFEKEIKLIEAYRDKILELKALGNVPEAMFSDIADMDMETATEFLTMLLSADESARNGFIKDYGTYLQTANSAAAELNGTLNAEGLKKEGIYLSDMADGELYSAKTATPTELVNILEKSFSEVPEAYYSLGDELGGAFAEGFGSRLESLMDETKAYVVSAMRGIAEEMSAVLKGAAEGGISGGNVTYSSTYNFNASKDTTTGQLFAARNAATLARLRGGN